MNARFLQLHWLTSYPGTLLNRDEAGLGKRLPFGGVTRGRVSSQSLKRHLRLAGATTLDGAKSNRWALQNLDVPMGIRTKRAVEENIMPRARAIQPAADDIADAVKKGLLKAIYAKDAADAKKRQTLYFGEPELEFLAMLAAQGLACGTAEQAEKKFEERLKAERTNLRALKHGAGLGAALFGRMVTSDRSANTDAAIHVAHSLTVHAMERELDYMTVVDDLIGSDDDAGAAGVFDMELTSGLYLSYIVVDIEALVANLGGDRLIASKIIEHLVHLLAQVSPGAKKGSTAPYSWAELILAEAGSRQPRTLANAYREPVPLRTKPLLPAAVERMDKHLKQLDDAYGTEETRRQLAIDANAEITGVKRLSLDDLATWCAKIIQGDEGTDG